MCHLVNKLLSCEVQVERAGQLQEVLARLSPEEVVAAFESAVPNLHNLTKHDDGKTPIVTFPQYVYVNDFPKFNGTELGNTLAWMYRSIVHSGVPHHLRQARIGRRPDGGSLVLQPTIDSAPIWKKRSFESKSQSSKYLAKQIPGSSRPASLAKPAEAAGEAAIQQEAVRAVGGALDTHAEEKHAAEAEDDIREANKAEEDMKAVRVALAPHAEDTGEAAIQEAVRAVGGAPPTDAEAKHAAEVEANKAEEDVKAVCAVLAQDAKDTAEAAIQKVVLLGRLRGDTPKAPAIPADGPAGREASRLQEHLQAAYALTSARPRQAEIIAMNLRLARSLQRR